MNNALKNKKGTALFMALLILTGMLVVVLAAADVITRGIKMSRTQARSTKSYFAAEAGAERILWEVRKNNFNSSLCNDNDYINFSVDPAVCDSIIHTYVLTNHASYSVVYNSGPPIIFTSNGVYLGARRSVEVSY